MAILTTRVLLLAAVVALGATPACSSRKKGGKGTPTEPVSARPVPTAGATPGGLVPGNGGATVYDRVRNVTWLADGNLPATQTFGVKGINPSGSMDYKTALRWVAAMNAQGHLGRRDWSLPSTPAEDKGCSSHNRYSFGFDCRASSLAALYYLGLGLKQPQTAVPMPPNEVKGFTNFQPYLYWSASSNVNHADNENGFTTFSFNNGFQGSNVARNHIYALPMVKGKVADPPGKRGQTIYDAGADVSWLANANLAATEAFGVKGIAADGSMRHDTAMEWVDAMNKANQGKGYLGRTDWVLPPSVASDSTCSANNFGFGCVGSPLGRLYYVVLGLRAGEPVVVAPDVAVGPFHNVEPYLYWACHAAKGSAACDDDESLPVKGFAWSFSLGNGFQGTTTVKNQLYVTAWHAGL